MTTTRSPRLFLAHALCAALMLVSAEAAAVNACVAPARGIGGTGSPGESGIGGTGSPAKGIGGTGSPAQGIGGTGSPVAKGIGGTGDVARGGIGGTGIVGTITGFASICVNAVEVHYGSGTPIEVDGKPAKADSLAIGQVVNVLAAGTGAEVQARRVSVLYAVAGPIGRVDAAAGRMEVLGQVVRLTPEMASAARGYAVGEFVRVSGLRVSNGDVVASRLERAPAAREVSVIGPVASVQGRGVTIQGLSVSLPANAPRGLAAGSEVQARGRLERGELHARQLVVEPSLKGLERVERLELQGYLQRRDGELRVGNVRLALPEQARILGGERGRLESDERVQVSGRVQDHRLVVERLQIEREGPARGERPAASGAGRSGRDEAPSGDSRSGRGEGKDATPEVDRGGRDNSGPDRSGPDRGGSDRSGHGGDDRPDRAEKVERPERVERPETVERPERVERPETVERVERPEGVDRSGRR